MVRHCILIVQFKTGCRLTKRVKSGNFGQRVNSDMHLQTVEIQMRRLIRIFTVCLVNWFFISIIKIWNKQDRCPNLVDRLNLADFRGDRGKMINGAKWNSAIFQAMMPYMTFLTQTECTFWNAPYYKKRSAITEQSLACYINNWLLRHPK